MLHSIALNYMDKVFWQLKKVETKAAKILLLVHSNIYLLLGENILKCNQVNNVQPIKSRLD